MGKTVLAAVAGYAAMFAFVFASFSGVFLVLGSDLSFQPGTYDASLLWIGVSIVLGCAAAVLGGYVCRLIASRDNAVRVLAAVVLVLGFITAGTQLAEPSGSADNVRTADVGGLDAMSKGRQPNWMLVVNPFIGAVFVIVGGNLRRRSEEASPPAEPGIEPIEPNVELAEGDVAPTLPDADGPDVGPDEDARVA